MGDISGKPDTAAPEVSKVEDNAVVDRSSTSATSTPEAEGEHDREPDAGGEVEAQEQPQQQKRKGGRKPIYATSEERKQRNRQAQAAFRERRTEYIKQLEQTIKIHEDTLQNLQQSHRSAADECLMLRYKNSLLERILLEKGIDVQAELHAKTGSPTLGPSRAPPGATPTTQPMQRYAIPKFPHNRRSLPPKADGIGHTGPLMPSQSPQVPSTSTSHLSSPALSTTKSPNFLPQGGTISPSFGPVAQQNPQLRPQPPPLRPQFAPQRPTLLTSYPGSSAASSASTVGSGAGSAISANSAGGPNYYPSPFQNHYDQLDQEYDAQADMMEDQEPSETSAGPYPPQFNAPMPPHGLHTPSQMQSQGPNQQLQPQTTPVQGPEGGGPMMNGMNNVFDPYDPMLDADPFGLSASMHFPTQFSFDTSR